MIDTATVLSRREATLRSGAITCLAGIALVQAIELPATFVRASQFALLSMAAMALCIAVGFALAAVPGRAGRQLWGAVAALSVLVLAAWAAPRAFRLPGLDSAHRNWTTLPGAASAALAVAGLVLAAAAAPPRRVSVRALATAVALLIAIAPGTGALLVALGPGPIGGEAALAAGAHVHSHGTFENSIEFRAGSGRHGSHFVVAVTNAPHRSVFELSLMVAMALLFVYGAVAHLLRRGAPAQPVPAGVAEPRLA